MITNYRKLHRNTIGKLKIICAILFIDHKYITIKKNGTVVFTTNKIWSWRCRVKKPITELLIYDIPRMMSVRRWNSFGLVDNYTLEIAKLIQSHHTDEIGNITEIVNYLYSELSQARIKDIRNNGSDVVMSFTPVIEDQIYEPEVVEIANIEYILPGEEKLETEGLLAYFVDYMKNIIYGTRYKVMAATLFLALNLSISITNNASVLQVLRYLYNSNNSYYFNSS
jgi:hypothetical protein